MFQTTNQIPIRLIQIQKFSLLGQASIVRLLLHLFTSVAVPLPQPDAKTMRQRLMSSRRGWISTCFRQMDNCCHIGISLFLDMFGISVNLSRAITIEVCVNPNSNSLTKMSRPDSRDLSLPLSLCQSSKGSV